ncbi:MAG TPA: hypothetical protein VLT45_31315 [Kofleriaceae bacterium]|nr:hypothetical protein [Kofleriaceae bacterium]
MLRKASLGLIMALAACGSARLIQQTPQGGVLELQGDRGKAMEDAQNQMAAQCGPNNYTIVQQGEEAIGTDTYSRQDSSAVDQTSRSGRTTTSDQTSQGMQSTRTAVAWRVHYQCNGAMPAAGQMPQQMPPPGGQPMPPNGQPPPPDGQPPAGPPPGPAPGY